MVAGSSSSNAAIKIVGARSGPGYFPGMKQPSLVAELSILQSARTEELARVRQVFTDMIPDFSSPPLATLPEEVPLLGLVAGMYERILDKAGIPVLGHTQAKHQTEDRYVLHLPVLDYLVFDAHLAALQWTVEVINTLLAGRSIESVAAALSKVREKLAHTAPRGMSSRLFIEEAGRADIPWKRLVANNYRFGIGSHARVFDNAFTDRTPVLGARNSHDKRLTALLLHSIGLPGARHGQAFGEQHAVKLAEHLGYPVVVKPANTDRGAGVAANLVNADMVRKGYAEARNVSEQVLVEKYFEGNDYRIQVLNGEAYWAVQRIPGGVTGDGRNNIRELLAEINADPRRGPRGTNALLKRIDFDDEAEELLTENGLTIDSIPADGQFVRLRRAANVASGGIPTPVLDIAHPDNLELAVRAAALLRLDAAGIDLIIPDISQSWLDVGALICEINANPHLHPSLPAYWLKSMLQDGGRIPIVVTVGKIPAWITAEIERLSATSRCIGSVRDDDAYINNRKILGTGTTTFQRCEAILSDQHVDAAVFCLSDDQLLKTGFPVDRFDTLLLLDDIPPHDAGEQSGWHEFVELLAALCTGEIVTGKRGDSWSKLLPPQRRNGVIELDEAQMVEVFVKTLAGVMDVQAA